MAQNINKDETLDPLSLSNPTTSGCGSTIPDPAHLPRPRSTLPKKRTAEESGSVLENEPAKKRMVNRCSGCRKRVGLTGFTCRCGDLFCSEHRYSDRHDCSFDYKTAGRVVIARENPVVRAQKLVKV